MLLGFKPRFEPFILNGSKTHTIRRKKRYPPKPGDICHCYGDARQKTMHLLGRWPCIAVDDIVIKPVMVPDWKSLGLDKPMIVTLTVSINGEELSPDETNTLFYRDGFRDRAAAKEGVRKRVFCASMADVMEDRRDLDIWRDKLWRLIESTSSLDWLLLSKRPQNYRRMVPASVLAGGNVWLGTTCESPTYYWRIGALATAEAPVHFLSMEPLLAFPMNLRHNLEDVEWIIAGGESDAGRKTARPVPAEWFRLIRDTAIELNIPFHFKQWGEFDGNLVRIGKKKAGSEIDGREWKQFPEVQRKAIG